MLNKKESLLRRDQAVSWLWACRKAGFNRDVARLIANHVFDGFHYLNGKLDFGYAGWLSVENGLVNGRSIDSSSYLSIGVLCQSVISSLAVMQFIIDGRDATEDEVVAIVDVLRVTTCGICVLVVDATGQKTKCEAFGDVLKFSPNRKWNFYMRDLKKLRIRMS